ncbi:hypothetical protein DPMN_027929 [Dreissena polymorpha]|uniref:Uncharacterized protein n=1 Tax=Dreissena polymorpha TaxID=45954 RepID=A0A9D4LW89_DREPO|nr:hypothetical protein DPMN_027929 [Dreissena polymorpha]
MKAKSVKNIQIQVNHPGKRQHLHHKKRQERRERVKANKLHERKQVWRSQKQCIAVGDLSETESQSPKMVFKYRTEKKRALDKFKQALPVTTIKRRSVLKSCLTESKSPTAKHIIRQMATPPDDVAASVLKNVKDMLTENKFYRSKEKRVETNAILSPVSGEHLSAKTSKTKVARRLGL